MVQTDQNSDPREGKMELSEIGVFVGADMSKTDHFARRNADRLAWLDAGAELLLE